MSVSPQRVSQSDLAGLVEPGQTIYLPGSSGAPAAFLNALLHDREFSRGLELLISFVPGINALDLGKLSPDARVTGLFMESAWADAQRCGRYRSLPMSYAGFVRHIHDQVRVDLAVVQVAPPDRSGRCSLGPAVEFLPAVLPKSRRVLALINPQVPRIADAPSLSLSDVDHVCEVDDPLATYQCEMNGTTEAIARNIADLIPDGGALQLGLGKVPQAVPRLLRGRRGLRLHSGLLSDGFMELADAGALDPAFPHTACVIVGSAALYSRLPETRLLRLAGCEFTHDVRTLAAIDGLIAVNGALEVDLFGQCNLEHAGGRAVSGVGGAPDFARGARLSRGGCSVVALNAARGDGKISRIVPMLGESAMVSLPRTDVDCVVTEHGIAVLSGASVHERVESLIQVAAPPFRAALRQSWGAIAARL